MDEGKADALFLRGRRAEYLERAMYVCPFCGLSRFESRDNEIQCKKCERKIHYGKDKRLTGVGFDFPFEFLTQWYEHQEQVVCTLDLTQHTQRPMYTDTARLSEVAIPLNASRTSK